jgi:hypothetical protein
MSGQPYWTFTIDESGQSGGVVHNITLTQPGGAGTQIVITDSAPGFTWTTLVPGAGIFESTTVNLEFTSSVPLLSATYFEIRGFHPDNDAGIIDGSADVNGTKTIIWSFRNNVEDFGLAAPPTYLTLTKPVYHPNDVAVNSNVCFVAGTLVKTDQGLVPIEQLDYQFHTINNQPIVAITQTRSTDTQLIYIPKNALGPEQPSQDTISSLSHKVLYNRVMTRAVNLPGVKMIPYEGQILYNVLLNNYSKMTVNNLTVETLDPRNDVAIIYKHIVTNNLSELEKDNLIQIYNERMDLQNQIKKEYVSSIVYTIMLKILTDSSV